MSFNPLAPLGSLNRLIASVTWPQFPQLNITPSFLGREAISLAFEGDATLFLPQLTGTVTSPEPYQRVTLTINLVRTQGIAALYEAQRQANSPLGPGVVRPDSSALPPYPLINCGILNVRELRFSGEDAGYVVSIGGYMLINASLWV
jgi:hypothetical protein